MFSVDVFVTWDLRSVLSEFGLSSLAFVGGFEVAAATALCRSFDDLCSVFVHTGDKAFVVVVLTDNDDADEEVVDCCAVVDGALNLFPMFVPVTPFEFSLASLGASLFELTVNVMQYK